MKRKQNDNGMTPMHPNPPSPGVHPEAAVREAAEDMDLAERRRMAKMGLNEFTLKSPWFRGGNQENQ